MGKFSSTGRRVGLVATFVLVSTALVLPPLPTIVHADTAADVGAIADGVERLTDVLSNLPSVESLASAVPFTGLGPAAAELLDVNGLLDSVKSQLALFADDTVAELEAFLSNPDGGDSAVDGTLPGGTIDIVANVSAASPYTITLSMTLNRDDVATPFVLVSPDVNGDGIPDSVVGGAYEIDLDANLSFTLAYDASLGFRVTSGSGSVGYAAAGTLSATPVRIGIIDAEGTGTANTSATLGIQLTDPDNTNGVTLDELNSTTAGDLFNVGVNAFSASGVITVSADTPGLGALTGTVTIAGDSPTTVGATFALGGLGDFRNASPLDIINGVAQIASSISGMQVSGLADLDVPFTNKSLAEVVDLAKGLKKFLVDNDITTLEDPLSPGSDPLFVPNLHKYDTIDEVAALLATALGTPTVPIAYDPTTKRLTFRISYSTTDEVELEPDLGGEVARVGIASVEVNGSKVTLSAGASIDLAFGIDLGAPVGTPLGERIFVDASTDGPELALELGMDADLDLAAAIGFVALRLTDSNAVGDVPTLGTEVPILSKVVGNTAPTVTFDVADGSADDGILTVDELFTALEANQFGSLGTLAINAAVPLTTITATAGIGGGSPLATGTVTIAWPNVTVGAPTVQANTDFATNLLDFSFDAANPLELFTQILDAVQGVVDGFNDTISGNPLLNTSLPIVGTSFQQVADKFDQIRASIDSVIGDPENTLQDFETSLENELGEALGVAPANRGGLLTFTLNTSGPKTVILASLDLGICSDALQAANCTVLAPISKDLNLGLGGSNLVGTAGGLQVALKYAATISLDVGVELPEVTAGLPPTVVGTPSAFVLDTSQVTLKLGGEASGNFSAFLGPLNVGVGADGKPATVKVGASFVLANPNFGVGPGVDRVPLNQVGAFLLGAIPSDFSPTPLVSCDNGTTSGDACAVLPIHIGGVHKGDITFRAPDLLNPATWEYTGVTAILNQVVAQGWDFTTLLNGLNALFDQIKIATDGQNFGASVPILGDALDAGAKVANAFKDNVVTPLTDIVNSFSTQTSAGALAGVIDTTLTTKLSTAGLLIDRGVANDTSDDVEVIVRCGAALTICDPSAAIFQIHDIEVQLSLGTAAASANIGFDLGLPGLSLEVKDDPLDPNDTISAGVNWRLDLAFGISRTDGFYLRTDNPVQGAAVSELTVTPSVDLPNKIFGTLAFIPVSLEDVHDGPDLSLTLGANLTSTGGKLSLAQLLAGLDPGVGIGITVDGTLDVQLKFKTGLSPKDIAATGSDPPSLPVFEGTFVMAWDFSAGAGTNIEAFADSTAFTIGLQDVSIDLGSFVNNFLKPITGELDRFARPIKPVLDVLNAPIPGIKELAETVGFPNPPPTMLDLIDLQNGPESTVLIRRLIMLVNFIVDVNNAGGQPVIKLGDLNIKPDVAKQGALSGTEAKKLIQSVINELPAEFAKPLQGLADTFEAKLNTAADAGGFTFPAFDNPGSLIGILIGQDVDLVRFDAGKLEAKFTKAFKFGPPIGVLPISVGATVTFKVTGHLEIGYDTRGIRDAIRKLTNDDPNDHEFLDTVATLLQGVYLDDNKDGVDVPEISLFGSVSVHAAVDILIAEAGIRGGVKANLDLNLHDGGLVGDPDPPRPEDLDGKLRIDEIIRGLKGNPICLFDATGKLTVFLELYEWNVISGEDTWPLASATIADFDAFFLELCDKTPKLARVVDGTLVLHVGPEAGAREFQPDVKDEKMTVSQIGPNKVSVSGFGFVQEFDGVQRVFGAGLDGKDELVMQAGGIPAIQADGSVTSTVQPFAFPVVLCGGEHDDILVGGDGNDRIYGDGAHAGFDCNGGGSGNGNDRINGGNGNDELRGGAGTDTIGGDAGDDRAFGDDGNDLINGGFGNDPELRGGNGPDKIIGGDGDDTMHGEVGADTLTGGRGNDTGHGNEDADTIEGGDGIDTLHGGAQDDRIFGGPGADTINGDGEDDDLVGDGGVDTINGGPGGDDIIGGADGDIISGGTERDYVIGDDGSIVRGAGQANGTAAPGTALNGGDTINGDDGDDVLFGGNGIDTMHGGNGLDAMFGGGGNDIMNGNADVDTMNGDGDDDTMHGDDANDVMRGGDGGDTMFGDAGNDEMYGDAGTDTMSGNDGADTIRGNTGNDRMSGNAENDNMHGDADNDCMTGDGGADTMFGDSQNDRMAGGSPTAGQPDGADVMDGGDGHDVMAGDNADLCDGRFVLHDQPFLDALAPDASWSGDDSMHGSGGNDFLYGQGRNETLVAGDAGDDHLEGNGGTDLVEGGDGSDELVGGSGFDLGGPAGAKRTFENTADSSDTLLGGNNDDRMAGDNAILERVPTPTLVLLDVPFLGVTVHADTGAADTLMGGDGADIGYGQAGDDDVYGQAGDDYLEGNSGADDLRGANGQDDIAGGSGRDHGPHVTDGPFRKLAKVLDESDTIDGGADQDVLAGNNAFIGRPGGTTVTGTILREIELYDMELAAGPAVDPLVHGPEVLDGGLGDDTIFGQGDNDAIWGGDGDDYAEGNTGEEAIYGGVGQDDLIGGGSASDGIIDADREPDGLLDGEDLLVGDVSELDDPRDEGTASGDGADVMMGDNGRIIKLTLSATQWQINPTTGDIERSTRQGDVEYEDVDDVPTSVHGDDELYGNDNDDIMRGQGGLDLMYGGAGSDDMEGNPAADVMFGQAGQDDMVGGSGRDGTAPAYRQLRNVLDEGDQMDGGPDQDVMLGDNGSLTRPGTSGLFGTIDRTIELYDIEISGGAVISPDVSGGENPIIGGTGNDTIFGQGGDDLVLAGDGEDYAEGNHGDDDMFGGAGQDDLIGGGSAADGKILPTRIGNLLLDGEDLLVGDVAPADDPQSEGEADGNGADVIMGDNARVIKLTTATDWLARPGSGLIPGNGDIDRSIVQFDVEDIGAPVPTPADVHGGDLLYGNDNDDVMRGQGAADKMWGGHGDDDMEGNPDADEMYGQSGQDDMIGGSRVAARHDAGDLMFGGPHADFQLGDNGDLVREPLTPSTFRMYVEANVETIVRTTTRHDVGGHADASGADDMYGEAGDDAQWGQDDDDRMWGGSENDDMFGELGADRMFGETGEDAMLGDRGGVVNRELDGSAGDPTPVLLKSKPPHRLDFTAFRSGTLDRRVDLRSDPNSTGTGFSSVLLAKPGTTDGGNDFMLGGPDRDSMHGGAFDDIMNGQSGGDTLFGDDGRDVMWGGKGCDPALDGAAACPNLDVRGPNDKFVDYLFGGFGGPPRSMAEAAADIMDYRPRPGIDPAGWFEATSTRDTGPVVDPLSAHQHHQGIDWMYGGWDRDVMEANVSENGPNDGDKMMDWPGNTHLFLGCNAAYGGSNDLRSHSPALQDYLQKLAHALGAGPTLADVTTPGTSGYNELAMVYVADIKFNSGKAFSNTPGHFSQFSCAP